MSTTLAPLVRSYVHHRRVEGLANLTLRNIRRTLDDFDLCFGRRPVSHLGAVAVDRWLERNEGRWVASTRAVRVSIVRTFARWCEAERATPNWSQTLPRVRRPDTVPRYVDRDQFAATLDAALSTRERAILWLLFGCGLRCVEVARLRVEDWDRRDGVLIAHGKGGHQRRVPVPPPVDAALRSYLAERPAAGGPVIRRADGVERGLSPNTVSSLTRRMLHRAGVKAAAFDGVCAHGMRAAAATSVLEASNDIRVAQELLGHRHASTTSVYLRRARLESVREALVARADLPTA